MRYPRIIAHRCGGGLAPENTLAGLEVAARLGCRGVEFDAMLSADGVPVLVHDETLERTTNLAGRVAATSAGDLALADAGARHHPAFSGERLPTLQQALEACARLGLWANVEIKPSAGCDAETGERVAQLAAARGNVLFSSFSVQALAAASAAAPRIPRALLLAADAQVAIEIARDLGAMALHLPLALASKPGVDKARGAGLEVAVYTVNHRPLAEQLFQRGIRAVFTDRPDLWQPEEM